MFCPTAWNVDAVSFTIVRCWVHFVGNYVIVCFDGVGGQAPVSARVFGDLVFLPLIVAFLEYRV